MSQVFLLPEQRAQLLANGRQTAKDHIGDHIPVVKFFTPDANATWLLTELDPDDNDIAFGLCDLGLGFPELGSVWLSEIQSVRGAMGLPVERDIAFVGRAPISVYADKADRAGHIVEIDGKESA